MKKKQKKKRQQKRKEAAMEIMAIAAFILQVAEFGIEVWDKWKERALRKTSQITTA